MHLFLNPLRFSDVLSGVEKWCIGYKWVNLIPGIIYVPWISNLRGDIYQMYSTLETKLKNSHLLDS